MTNKLFGAMVAGAVAGLMTGGVALAKDKKAAPKKDKKEAKAEGWCKSNECGGKVAGAKNECAGKMACKGITEETCKTGGTWTTEAKPK